MENSKVKDIASELCILRIILTLHAALERYHLLETHLALLFLAGQQPPSVEAKVVPG